MRHEHGSKRSMLCPNCRKLISTDEPMCPYCGLVNPGSWWKSGGWVRIFSDGDLLIRIILFANVGMYVMSLVIDSGLRDLSLNPLTFLAPGNKSLLLLGATGTIPIGRFGRWWSLLAANYLHGGLLHILFNMMALRQIGPFIVREYGVSRTIILYTLGGVLGYLVSYLAGVRLTIGASAAVCSLIGAALYFGKSRGGSFGQAVYRQVGGWAVSIFVFGLLVPGINNWGHGGGLVGGLVLGFLLGYSERIQETPLQRLLAVVCVAATAITLGWAVLAAILAGLTD